MFLSFFPIVLSILTALPTLIREAETAFSGHPGSGEAKKELVLDTVKSALGAYEVVSSPLPDSHTNAILDAVSSLTDSTVTAINAAKLVLGSDTTPAPQPKAK